MKVEVANEFGELACILMHGIVLLLKILTKMLNLEHLALPCLKTRTGKRIEIGEVS